MEIKVHAIHFTADKKLIDIIHAKLGKLELLFDNITACEVYLKLDKDQEKENKIVELKMLIPGKTLVAKKQCRTFEEATDLSVEALRKQVSKHKEKV